MALQTFSDFQKSLALAGTRSVGLGLRQEDEERRQSIGQQRKDALPKPPKPAKAPRQSLESQVDERAITRESSNMALDAIGGLGNLLDLPGSMVRDAVMLRNPFDQLLTPTKSVNRTTGEEMAEAIGAFDDGPSENRSLLTNVGRFAGGIGIEVALDPLTYLTGGLASTIRGAGKGASSARALKKIGVLDNLDLYNKAGKGKRVSALEMTARDAIENPILKKGQNIQEESNRLRKAYEGALKRDKKFAKEYKAADDVGKAKLIEEALDSKLSEGYYRFRIPGVVDKSFGGARRAKIQDDIGEFSRYSPVGLAGYRAFSKPYQKASTKESQKAIRKVRSQFDADYAKVREEMFDNLREIDSSLQDFAGAANPEENAFKKNVLGNLMREYAEDIGRMKLPTEELERLGLIREIPDADTGEKILSPVFANSRDELFEEGRDEYMARFLGDVSARDGVDDEMLERLTSAMPAMDRMKDQMDRVIAEAPAYGLPLEQLVDDFASYFPRVRQTSSGRLATTKVGSKSKLFDPENPFRLMRGKQYRNLTRGTAALNEMSLDREFAGIYQPKVLNTTQPKAEDVEKAKEAFFKKYDSELQGMPKAQKDELFDSITTLPRQDVDRQISMYSINPAESAMQAVESAYSSRSQSEALRQLFKDTVYVQSQASGEFGAAAARAYGDNAVTKNAANMFNRAATRLANALGVRASTVIKKVDIQDGRSGMDPPRPDTGGGKPSPGDAGDGSLGGGSTPSGGSGTPSAGGSTPSGSSRPPGYDTYNVDSEYTNQDGSGYYKQPEDADPVIETLDDGSEVQVLFYDPKDDKISYLDDDGFLVDVPRPSAATAVDDVAGAADGAVDDVAGAADGAVDDAAGAADGAADDVADPSDTRTPDEIEEDQALGNARAVEIDQKIRDNPVYSKARDLGFSDDTIMAADDADLNVIVSRGLTKDKIYDIAGTKDISILDAIGKAMPKIKSSLKGLEPVGVDDVEDALAKSTGVSRKIDIEDQFVAGTHSTSAPYGTDDLISHQGSRSSELLDASDYWIGETEAGRYMIRLTGEVKDAVLQTVPPRGKIAPSMKGDVEETLKPFRSVQGEAREIGYSDNKLVFRDDAGQHVVVDSSLVDTIKVLHGDGLKMQIKPGSKARNTNPALVATVGDEVVGVVFSMTPSSSLDDIGLKIDRQAVGKAIDDAAIGVPKESGLFDPDMPNATRILKKAVQAIGEEEAVATMASARAYAAVWAKSTGKDPDEYFERLGLQYANEEDIAKMGANARRTAETTRAFLSIYKNGKFDITLLPKRRRSTFAHELAHMFLYTIHEIDPELIGRAADGINLIADKHGKKRIGPKGRADIDSWSTFHHEAWAEGFQRYLQEGKAPTPELKSSYEKFKTWLTELWKSLSDRNAYTQNEINQELREVYSYIQGGKLPKKPASKPSKASGGLVDKPKKAAPKTSRKKPAKGQIRADGAQVADPDASYSQHVSDSVDLVLGNSYHMDPEFQKPSGIAPKPMAENLIKAQESKSINAAGILEKLGVWTDGTHLIKLSNSSLKNISVYVKNKYGKVEDDRHINTIRDLLGRGSKANSKYNAVEEAGYQKQFNGDSRVLMKRVSGGEVEEYNRSFIENIRKHSDASDMKMDDDGSLYFYNDSGDTVGLLKPIRFGGKKRPEVPRVYDKPLDSAPLATGDYTYKTTKPVTRNGRKNIDIVASSASKSGVDSKGVYSGTAFMKAEYRDGEWVVYTGKSGSIEVVARGFKNQKQLMQGLDRIVPRITDVKDGRPRFTEVFDGKTLREEVRQMQGDDIWSYPPNQKYKSDKTSINANKLPQTVKQSWFSPEPGSVIADIGGGRFDNVSEFLAKDGVTSHVYDPFNRSPEHNEKVYQLIRDGQSDYVMANNVLNVIMEPENRERLVRQSANALKEDGEAYFLLHFDPKAKGVGKSTQKNQSWQNHQKAEFYRKEVEKHFDEVEIKGSKYIIARKPKKTRSGEAPVRRLAEESSPQVTRDVVREAPGVDRIQIGTGPDVPTLRNPTVSEAASLLKNSGSGELRAISDGLNIWFWDAGRALHHDAADSLGLSHGDINEANGLLKIKSENQLRYYFDRFEKEGSFLPYGQVVKTLREESSPQVTRDVVGESGEVKSRLTMPKSNWVMSSEKSVITAMNSANGSDFAKSIGDLFKENLDQVSPELEQAAQKIYGVADGDWNSMVTKGNVTKSAREWFSDDFAKWARGEIRAPVEARGYFDLFKTFATKMYRSYAKSGSVKKDMNPTLVDFFEELLGDDAPQGLKPLRSVLKDLYMPGGRTAAVDSSIVSLLDDAQVDTARLNVLEKRHSRYVLKYQKLMAEAEELDSLKATAEQLGENAPKQLTDKIAEIEAAVKAGDPGTFDEWMSDVVENQSQPRPRAKVRNIGVEVNDKSIIGEIKLPDHIANDVVNIHNALSFLEDDKNIGGIVKAYDWFTSFFKTNVTATNPGFHGRNFLSGFAQNALNNFSDPGYGPMNPMRFVKPYQDAGRLMKGQLVEDASSIPIFEGLSEAEATEELAKLLFMHKVIDTPGPHRDLLGVGDPSIVSQMIGPQFGKKKSIVDFIRKRSAVDYPTTEAAKKSRSKGESARQGVKKAYQRYVENMQNVGDAIEIGHRAGGFIALLRQGVDPAEASRLVKSAHVDYSSLTDMEKAYLRRAFPFYSFSKGMSAYLAKELTSNPAGPIGIAIRAQNRGSDRDVSTPDYLNKGLSLQYRTGADGTRHFISGLGLMHEQPVEQIAPFISMDPGRSFFTAISNMNPLPKAFMELAFDESGFQEGVSGGVDLDDADPALGRAISNIGNTLGITDRQDPLRIGKNTEALISASPFSRYVNTTRSLFDPRKNLIEKAFNNLTGIRMTALSPQRQDAVLRERLDQFLQEKGARTFAKQYIPDYIRERFTPEEREVVEQYEALIEILGKRSKERKQLTENQKAGLVDG